MRSTSTPIGLSKAENNSHPTTTPISSRYRWPDSNADNKRLLSRQLITHNIRVQDVRSHFGAHWAAGCWATASQIGVSVAELQAKFEQILPHLDGRRRRLYLAGEATVCGHGGISLVAAVRHQYRHHRCGIAALTKSGPPSGYLMPPDYTHTPAS